MEDINVFENEQEATYVPDSRTLFMQEISQYPLLTSDQQKDLLKIVKNGNAKDRKLAIERLILCNLRLVVSMANKYSNFGVDFMDLAMEGTIGLRTGIEKFDYTLGYELSTYVTNWIKQSICRCIESQGRTIRVPVHMHEKIRKYKRVISDLTTKFGREPSDDEVAKKMKVKKDEVEKLSLLTCPTVSLDKPVGDEEDSTVGDFISDSDNDSPETNALRTVAREKLIEAMNTLKPRTKKILELRYGFNDGVVMTLDEIGKELGITRERVRQIENIGLRTLGVKAKELKDLLLV